MSQCCTLMYIVVQVGVMMFTNEQHYYNDVQWCYIDAQQCASVLQQHVMMSVDIETWYRTRWLCVTQLRDVVMMCKSSFQWNDNIATMLPCCAMTWNNIHWCCNTQQRCFLIVHWCYIKSTTLSWRCYKVSTLLNIVQLSYDHVTKVCTDCNIVLSSNIHVHLHPIMYM